MSDEREAWEQDVEAHQMEVGAVRSDGDEPDVEGHQMEVGAVRSDGDEPDVEGHSWGEPQAVEDYAVEDI